MNEVLERLQPQEQDTYTYYLCKVVGISTGGHGQVYGNLSRLVFATVDEHCKAWNMMISDIVKNAKDGAK